MMLTNQLSPPFKEILDEQGGVQGYLSSKNIQKRGWDITKLFLHKAEKSLN